MCKSVTTCFLILLLPIYAISQTTDTLMFGKWYGVGRVAPKVDYRSINTDDENEIFITLKIPGYTGADTNDIYYVGPFGIAHDLPGDEIVNEKPEVYTKLNDTTYSYVLNYATMMTYKVKFSSDKFIFLLLKSTYYFDGRLKEIELGSIILCKYPIISRNDKLYILEKISFLR